MPFRLETGVKALLRCSLQLISGAEAVLSVGFADAASFALFSFVEFICFMIYGVNFEESSIRVSDFVAKISCVGVWRDATKWTTARFCEAKSSVLLGN